MIKKLPALLILDIVSVVLFLVALFLVFFYAPLEATMGQVQRVFYFHVSTAWVGMLGFTVAALVGIVYLRTGNLKWDIAAMAAIEISLVFFLVAIVTGSIWARPIWNTWWTWDPRLTTAAIVELAYAAYWMLRQGIDDPERRARFGAVYALVSFLSVPLTFISIRLLRTIHPVVIGGASAAADGGFSMTAPMRLTFFFSLFVFTVIFIDLFWRRLILGRLAHQVEWLKFHVTQ